MVYQSGPLVTLFLELGKYLFIYLFIITPRVFDESFLQLHDLLRIDIKITGLKEIVITFTYGCM